MHDKTSTREQCRRPWNHSTSLILFASINAALHTKRNASLLPTFCCKSKPTTRLFASDAVSCCPPQHHAVQLPTLSIYIDRAQLLTELQTGRESCVARCSHLIASSQVRSLASLRPATTRSLTQTTCSLAAAAPTLAARDTLAMTKTCSGGQSRQVQIMWGGGSAWSTLSTAPRPFEKEM